MGKQHSHHEPTCCNSTSCFCNIMLEYSHVTKGVLWFNQVEPLYFVSGLYGCISFEGDGLKKGPLPGKLPLVYCAGNSYLGLASCKNREHIITMKLEIWE